MVHSHTWYTGMAGHIAALLYGIPHVLTAHSLEPMRPWKAEQLGGGYRVSLWVERTAVEAADAVIAVSSGMRDDVLSVYPALDPNRVHVVKNGIDTDVWYPAPPEAASRCWPSWVSTRPGRWWFRRPDHPAEGVPHLIAAAHHFDPEVQVVLCAGAPDTRRSPPRSAPPSPNWPPRAAASSGCRSSFPSARSAKSSRRQRFHLPVGVRAAGDRQPGGDGLRDGGDRLRRGRHPEVVDDGVTGTLVHYERRRSGGSRCGWPRRSTPGGRPDKARRYGVAGRQRCIDEFSWAHIAEQTLEITAR